MKHFKRVIKEINRSIGFLMFFETLLNAIVLFLIVYLLLTLIQVKAIYAVVPAVVFLVIRMYVNSKIDKKKMVEKEYKPLREKLRTAADNIKGSKENPIIQELQEEVVHDLKNVGLSSFFHTKGVTFKIFLTMILSFAIVFSTTLDLYIVDFNKLIQEIPELIENAQNPGKKRIEGSIDDVNETDDIYGDSKLAVLGNDEIDIRIKPVNFEVSVRDEGEADQKEFAEIFPSEVAVEQSSAFEEHIPEEEQELVKSYFNQLNR